MFRKNDFCHMDVLNINGKRVGFVSDLIIDFNKCEVLGFSLSCNKFFHANFNVLNKDILYFNDNMVVNNITSGEYFSFNSIKNMDLIDKKGNIIGMVEDIIFDYNFKIYGIIISTGLIKSLISGKKIVLMSDLILGEENIYYYKTNNNINFFSMPHKIITKVDCYEKNI